MIKCNRGTAEFEGDPVMLSAETTSILNGLLETYKTHEVDDVETRLSHNFLIKSIMYAFTRRASELGYDTHFSQRDLDTFDQVYREVYGDGKD